MSPGSPPGRAVRTVVVTPIPTPYRDAWFDAVAAHPDVELTVVYLGPAHPRRRSWSRDGWAPTHRSVVVSDRVVERGERALHPVVRAGRVLGPLRPEVVVVGGWDQPFFWSARAWARARGVAFVPHVESHARSGARRDPLTDALRRRFIAGADAVIVPSEEAEDYVRWMGHQGPVLVLPNPVPAPVAPGAATPPAEGGARLLFLGGLAPRKNPALAVRIADALAARGRAVHLDVVGGGEGPLPVASAAEVVRWGFLGPAELEARWAAADVLLVPSLADPAPLVLSEAAARGVPFLASDRVGGATTLVRRGAAGAVVPLGAEPARWAEVCEALLSAPPHPPLEEVLAGPSADTFAGFVVGVAGPSRHRHEIPPRRAPSTPAAVVREASAEDLPAVVALLAATGGPDPVRVRRALDALWDHPRVGEGARLVVATVGDALVACQAWVPWPLVVDGEPRFAHQVGPTAVHPGVGDGELVGRMLAFGEDALGGRRGVLFAFPAGAGHRAFLRAGWSHPLDLVWYVRPVVPRVRRRPPAHPPAASWDALVEPPAGVLGRRRIASIEAWRRARLDPIDRRRFVAAVEGGRFAAELRRRVRGPSIGWVIEDVAAEPWDPIVVREGLRALVAEVGRHTRRPAVVALAVPGVSARPLLRYGARSTGFVPTRRRIRFVLRAEAGADDPRGSRPGDWFVQASDVFSW